MDKLHPGPLIAQRGNLKVIDCAQCGYAHLTELPTPEALTEFYKSDFWQKEKAGALEHFEAQFDWWLATYTDWLALADEVGVPGGQMLDVGCGYGFLLEAASRCGYEVTGLDPNVEAVRYVRGRWPGRTVWHAEFETLFIAHQYELISACWVIEHVADPLAFLKRCHHLLAPDGVLLIAVPNEFTSIQVEANLIAKFTNWWVHHTHLNYFTRASLSNLLGRAGFRLAAATATFPMELNILNDRDYTDDSQLGALIHKGLEQSDLEQAPEKRRQYYRHKALTGEGRDLVLVAVKE